MHTPGEALKHYLEQLQHTKHLEVQCECEYECSLVYDSKMKPVTPMRPCRLE